MAKIRRVVRKVEPSAAHYFDEQLWPIQIALVVLGGFLMGVSLAYQPLSGVAWYRTAWPSLIGIPLVIAAAIVAFVYVDNRLVRRSLQLSLVLCAIVHVAFVVQMFEMRLFSGAFKKERSDQAIVERRPPKIVPEYHPTQLVPEEDRPRQDFERPVEAESPAPSPEPERIVRQPNEEERSPAQPQPVPVPEQQPTTEPNVVSRQRPNEAAPRLAAHESRLSRQVQPSLSRLSQPVDMPAAVRQLAESAEATPTIPPLERQRAETTPTARQPVEPATTAVSREAQLARRTSESSPAAESSAPPTPYRAVTEPVNVPQTQIAAVAPPTPAKAPTNDVQPTRTSATRQNVSQSVTQRRAEVAADATPVSATDARRTVARAEPTVSPKLEAQSAVAHRAVAAAPSATSSAAMEGLAAAGPKASASDSQAQPAPLALSRGEAGVVGRRRSANLDTAVSGGPSPALMASSAARRAEATQRDPTGDALSTSAPARIARSRAQAEIPTAAVKAEQLESASAPGAAQIAEVTASSGAAVTRADAAARRDAVTGAKGAGEIDFGPTQVLAEAGSGRASGGGQPELHLQSLAAAPVRRTSGGAPLATINGRAIDNVGAPAAAPGAPQQSAEAGPAATAAVRGASESTMPSGRFSLAERGEPMTAANSLAVTTASPGRRADAAEGVPPLNATSSGEGPPPSGGTNRQTAAVAAGGATNVADIPEVGPRSAVAQAELDHVVPGISRAALSRNRGEALIVDIQAPAGPGGLTTDFTPVVGVNSRQAQNESLNVQLRATRFLRSQVGGLPAVSTAAVIPTEAFSSRAARVRGQERAGGSGSQSPETEEAIERGLAFLARYQGASGGWSLQGFPEGANLVSDTAATALAVLAFQGAGYNHREFQYRDVVRGGIAYLLKGQKENGDLFVPLDDASNKSVWLYSHSLAAIAICEAYGMTQDPALREPAQKAIDFIVDSQEQRRGGWRYAPGVGSDTSVTGWMMMALKSGELAGLDVSPATYRRIGRWLDDAQQSRSEPHLYRYNPHAPDTAEQRHGRTASKTMTAVGLLMRLYTGWRRDNSNMVRGAAFLVEHLPANGTAREPLRDTYYWYYATQVMAHVGGAPWEAWMARLHPLLVNSQIRQGPYGGSWDPMAPIADRWGPHAGRIYVTTMNLLSLEVQHRKLPLHEDVAR